MSTRNLKDIALAALAQRKANVPPQINNASLYAGSPMYFYCQLCGHQSDVVPELYIPSHNYPKKYCAACQPIVDAGWLDEE